MSEPLVHLIRGDDEILIADAIATVIDDLVGDGDKAMMLEELDVKRYEADGDRTLWPLVDAAQTPPFLTDKRVVVGRQMGAFTKAADVEGLVAYLEDPLPTTRLVLGWEPHPTASVRSGPPPKKLLDALKKVGANVVNASAGSGKAFGQWLEDHLRDASVNLDAAARKLVGDQIGEDASLLMALLPVLEAVYGQGAKLGIAEVEPYLGDQGSVKPWDLTDAIDKGDAALAVSNLHRMTGSGMHPLQILSTLSGHVLKMAALDGSGDTNEQQAAATLGLKGSTFPAKKALSQSRKLGSETLREFVQMMAKADLDLRGATALPNEVVIEVLVARLASRSRRG